MRARVSRVRGWATDLLGRARRRLPPLDHAVRAVDLYGDALGSQLAAGVTYYAFLSFFPIVALAYAAVGYAVVYVPGADEAVTTALSSVLPGMVGEGSGRLDIQEIAGKKAGVGLIGLIGLLYTGLGAISALRTALYGVFHPGHAEDRRNLVVGKAMDLLVLVVLGLIALVSVGLGAAVTTATGSLVRALGGSGVPGLSTLLWVLGVLVGIAASTAAFFVAYRLLPKEPARPGDLWKGALLAAVGFEVLKQLAGLVLGQVTDNVLYSGFAVLVALLVWMNYTSRLAVLGATWAATAGPHPEKAS